MRLLVAFALALLAGCAGVSVAPSPHVDSGDRNLRECAQWYSDLDARIDASGVRDAQDTRIAGFPYLRLSRFLASFRDAASADPKVFDAMVERMQALDIEARQREVANLPESGGGTGGNAAARAAVQHASACGFALRQADTANPAARAAMIARATVPDDYSSLGRAAGLYFLTRVPFSAGVRRYQAEAQQSFERAATDPGAGLVRYGPPSAAPRLPRSMIAAMLESAAANPLGAPELRAAEMEPLFATYAPSFEIEIRGDYDRFGSIRWLRGASMPAPDGAELVVYTNAAWTRYRGRSLLQLVYTLWFPERPADGPNDILAGKLDGITWRVTLAPDGEPLVYDAMHPCGCYHMFFPTPRAQAVPAPEGEVEWMFSPASMPRMAEEERPLVRIASGTHYIERVGSVHGPGSLVRYELRPYDDLRSIAGLDGRRRSMFGPDGIVAGSERPERFLFWPMGIPSAGAMRQWGRHATAFVGRRHFDDPDLLEKRFTLQLR